MKKTLFMITVGIVLVIATCAFATDKAPPAGQTMITTTTADMQCAMLTTTPVIDLALGVHDAVLRTHESPAQPTLTLATSASDLGAATPIAAKYSYTQTGSAIARCKSRDETCNYVSTGTTFTVPRHGIGWKI